MRRIWITGLAMMMGGCAAGGGQDFGPRGGPGMGPPPPGMTGPGGYNRLFISPMGEPFRVRQPERAWFDGADTNHDDVLTPEEFRADAARFFALLDRDHDGEIDPQEMEYYETVLAPEIRVAGPGGGGGGPGGGGGRRGGGGPPGGGPGGGGPGGGADGQGMRSTPGGFSFRSGGTPERQGRQGAGRFSYLDFPQPVIVADRNFNRGVDPQEFASAADDRFAALDRNGDGRIERGELPTLGPAREGGPGARPMEGGD